MGEPKPKQDAAQDVHDALVPVAMAPPKAPAPKDPAVAFDDRVPNVGEILDPARPSLDGVDSKAILAIVTRLVDDLYREVLYDELTALQSTLAEVPVPKNDASWVLKLIEFAVELTATLTLTQIGGLAAGKLFGNAEEGVVPKIAEKGNEEVGKAGGKKFGEKVAEGLESGPEAATEGDAAATAHGDTATVNGSLVEEYLKQQRMHLVVKKNDALARLVLLSERAAKVNPGDVARLDEQLRELIQQNVLRQWFRQRIALEWMNVLARVSLGPRAQGQTTNFAGANTSGGFHEAGARGTKQWRGGDGFVDIVIDVRDGGAPSIADVTATGRPGVAGLLSGLSHSRDAGGVGYKLGSMPVFRRIWLQTDDSKLGTNPAFAITPEGALEVNYDDPALARLGGDATLDGATAYDRYDGRDSKERADRSIRATHAMIGAQKVMMLLATESTEKIK